VQPNYFVDAPRINAIRGSSDGCDAAVITSVGSTRAAFKKEREAPEQATEKDDAMASVLEPAPATAAAGAALSSPPRPAGPPPAKARPAPRPVAPAVAEQQAAGEAQQEQEELWRRANIARGVPKADLDPPRTQEVACSDQDTAKLLESRGHIAEIPDMPEDNQLKRMLVKKADWLYSPKDSLILSQKRNAIQQMVCERGVTQTWTAAGRLVCGDGGPPPDSVPISAGPPPHLARQRAPFTLSEITEQRIIDAARKPPAPSPSFMIEVCRQGARGGAEKTQASDLDSQSARIESREGAAAGSERK